MSLHDDTEMMLLIVEGKIRQLPIKQQIKKLMMENMALAMAAFNLGNIIETINNIQALLDMILICFKNVRQNISV